MKLGVLYIDMRKFRIERNKDGGMIVQRQKNAIAFRMRYAGFEKAAILDVNTQINTHSCQQYKQPDKHKGKHRNRPL